LQGAVTRSVVEQEGNSVAKDLPQQPARQVPEVLGPHSLYAIALRELREDSVDSVTNAAQIGASLRVRVVLLAPVGREELDTHTPRHLSFGFGRPVVAVSNGETAGRFEEFGEYRQFVGIGRGNRDAADEPRPANAHMHPKAVEGLPEKRVLAEGGFSFEARAAVGAGKQASRQGQRVHQCEGRTVGSEGEEFLPEALLYLPEVGGLTGEGGAVDLPKGGNHSA
jgi:hypothetical protein